MREYLRRLVEHLNFHGRFHVCAGIPLSKPLQNQGSASSEGSKNFGLPHKRGYDRLAAVSFKSDTTMTVAA